MSAIITIDKFAIHSTKCPNYCRGFEDKVRWVAFKAGKIAVIRPGDKVREDLSLDRYILEVSP